MVEMKRKVAIFLCMIMTLGLLSGCGKQETIQTNSGENQSPTEEESDVKEENEVQAENVINEEKEEKNVEEKEIAIEELTAANVVSKMKIGWNLGNTLDSHNANYSIDMSTEAFETAWGNPVTTKELIDAVVAKGFNVIRIPVTWDGHLIEEENWKIKEDWLDRVQEVVDYAYDNGVYVILNTHHESWYEPYYENEERAKEIMIAVWSQIADRFQDYDEHLIFEGMNEPRKIGAAVEWTGGDQEGWDVVNSLNETFVKTIRESDGNNPYRILLVTGYAANGWEGIRHLKGPEDNKVAVSVHAYEPYEFALNLQGRGNWNHDTANIDMIMNSLDTLFLSKGIPVVMGEFGALTKKAEGNEQDRAEFAEYYVNAAAKKGIPCLWWDNGAFYGSGELFGLIDRKTYEWKYPSIVDGMMKGIAEAE